MQAVTLGVAVLGAVLGLFNTVVNYLRGRVRWHIRAFVDQSKQAKLTLRVHIVNTGRIAIKVKQVFLAGRAIPGEKRVQIYTAQGSPRPGYALLPGDKVTLSPAQAAALREVVV